MTLLSKIPVPSVGVAALLWRWTMSRSVKVSDRVTELVFIVAESDNGLQSNELFTESVKARLVESMNDDGPTTEFVRFQIGERTHG